jgi:hypothetical protein
MAGSALELGEAAALVTAAVQGAAGAPRQVAAAVAAAAIRAAGDLLRVPAPGEAAVDEAAEEVVARVQAIAPMIDKQVRGQPVCGSTRVARNVASHVGFGCGAQALFGSVQELKRKQRGARRGKAESGTPHEEDKEHVGKAVSGVECAVCGTAITNLVAVPVGKAVSDALHVAELKDHVGNVPEHVGKAVSGTPHVKEFQVHVGEMDVQEHVGKAVCGADVVRAGKARCGASAAGLLAERVEKAVGGTLHSELKDDVGKAVSGTPRVKEFQVPVGEEDLKVHVGKAVSGVDVVEADMSWCGSAIADLLAERVEMAVSGTLHANAAKLMDHVGKAVSGTLHVKEFQGHVEEMDVQEHVGKAVCGVDVVEAGKARCGESVADLLAEVEKAVGGALHAVELMDDVGKAVSGTPHVKEFQVPVWEEDLKEHVGKAVSGVDVVRADLLDHDGKAVSGTPSRVGARGARQEGGERHGRGGARRKAVRGSRRTDVF